MNTNYFKNVINRQDARSAKVRESRESPFLAALAPWRFAIVSVSGRFGDF